MGNSLGNNYGKFYSFQSKPVELDLSFIVDATNGNGLGVRSIKGQGVRNVFMATSASFVGTTHTGTVVIDGIAGDTASLVVGMPIATADLPAGAKIQSIVSSTSITSTIAAGTGHTDATITYTAVGSPMLNTGVGAASVGLALIELNYNYTRIYGGPLNIVSPVSSSNLAINGTALTVGSPYVIVSVGTGAKGAVTIAPVADVSGSLASTYFKLFDSYGNTFIIWFSVSGVGSAPIGVPGTLVQQSILSGDSAATIGADLVITINGLFADTLLNPRAPHVKSFTSAGTTTVTVTNTLNVPFPGVPSDGLLAPTGFTFAQTIFVTNLKDWQNVGVPQGVVPAVGVSFIATSTGSSVGGGSTGLVRLPAVSNILSVETIGDSNTSLGPIPMGGSANSGGWILIQFLAPTLSSTTIFNNPMIPTAPALGSVIAMSFLLEAGTEVGGNKE